MGFFLKGGVNMNFDFLQSSFPVLATFGTQAEQYVFSDANSCILKEGMIGETIVNLIFTYDHIPLPYENNAANRIDTLLNEGLITRDLSDALHALRKARNKAIHENLDDEQKAKTLLQIAYGVCEWFMQTYGDWSYQNRPFVMPSPAAPVPVMATTESEDNQMIEAAKTVAAAAPQVNPKKRKAQSYKAAKKRPKNEAETRYLIDEQLRKVGWEADTDNLRYSKGVRPQKGRNIAIAEWPTDSVVGNHGFADYALFVGLQLIGFVEAKVIHKDIPSVLDYQCKDYSGNVRQEDEQYKIGTWGKYGAPFTFATNGRPYLRQLETKSGIWFLDLREKSNAPKALHGWPSPSGLLNLLGEDIEKAARKLDTLSYDILRDKNGLSLREYQIKAIKAVENALKNGQQDILLAMATGTGKTRTAVGLMYRFLSTERFKRILFLVDRNSLGTQAKDDFTDYKVEDFKSLTKIYSVQGLEDGPLNEETRVHIATVQGMVKRVLYSSDDEMPSVTDYDLIIVDEAHRGYILDREMGEEEQLFRDQADYQSKYRAVIEYFDAVRVALTATPALHTTELFGKPVYKYTYREAVIEGYLVDHDAPHILKTRLSTQGIHYKSGDSIIYLDPRTGELINSELLDDELDFDVKDFNRKVITEPFNRAVLEEIAEDIDPESPELEGKTLIYAVNDNHADLIVQILKEIYSKKGVDTSAIMKITGSVANGDRKKIDEAIRKFKNESFPSIVVTVDLLTTGIDVPAITKLVFLRKVKSRILFEQMLGRATRLCPEIHKTHFEIYDPARTYEDLKDFSTMKPAVVNPAASLPDLLSAMDDLENADEIQYATNQIIARMQRRCKNMTDEDMDQFKSLSGGKSPGNVVQELLQGLSNNADVKQSVQNYGKAIAYLENVKRPVKLVVVSTEEDELTEHTRGYGKSGRPEDYLDDFASFIQSNINEIASLNIVCTKPKELTRKSLKDLRLTLDREGFTTQQLNTAINELTNTEITADIITLIRRYAVGSSLISHEARIRRAVDRLKKAHSFSKAELNWLERIEKYLMKESVLNIDVFDDDYRFYEQGGFKKINKVFDNQLESIVLELNEYLYDDGGHTA